MRVPAPPHSSRPPSPPADATGYGVVGGENGETYYLGIIDVLEQWGGMKWPMQGAILKFFFRYVACGRWYNPDGITAIRPTDYAFRFEEFLRVLRALREEGETRGSEA